MTLAQTYAEYAHSWWTPAEWLQWVTASFGTVDWFDPCPEDWKGDGVWDGLRDAWGFPCYVNHPGDRRGSAQRWWDKFLQHEGAPDLPLIWCAFNMEQLRHLRPSPLELPGTLVLPRDRRVAFIWGGPTYQPTDKNGKPRGAKRVHGQPMNSPGNCTVFWASAGVTVAPPPVESIVVPTGGSR